MKKVLFDAGPIMNSNISGVGRYLELMIEALKTGNKNKISLTGYYFKFGISKSTIGEKNLGIKLIRIRFLPSKILSLLRMIKIRPPLEVATRFEQYDSVLFTNFVDLPIVSKNKIKKILFIYDLCFLDFPEYVQEKNLKYLMAYAKPSILRADAIVTVSNFTKSRIEKLFPDLKAEIVVTPIPPAAVKTKRHPLSARLKKLGIEQKKYLLFVGTVEPRKNINVLLDCVSELDESLFSDYKVVIAGGKGWKDGSILEKIDTINKIAPRIIMCGYVTNDEKSELYENASCFVLPSHYEGFGMPVLEAMLFRVPIVLSDIEVFHEVAGDSAVYFDKDRSGDLAEKIYMILTNKSLQKNLVDMYDEQLSKNTWSENVNRLNKII